MEFRGVRLRVGMKVIVRMSVAEDLWALQGSRNMESDAIITALDEDADTIMVRAALRIGGRSTWVMPRRDIVSI